MKAKTFIFIAAISVIPLVCGCERRPMFVISDGVLIRQTVDTSFVREGKPVPAVPGLFRVLAYDSKTGKSVTSDFISSGGGQFHVPAGDYDIMTYNFGTEYCIVENEYDRDGAYVHTSQMENSLGQLFVGATHAKEQSIPEVVTKASTIVLSDQAMDVNPDSKYYNMPVVFQPDYFWRGKVRRSVPYRSQEDPDLIIDVEAGSLVKTGHVLIRKVKGLENIGSVTLFLTNLTRRVSLHSGKPFPEAAVFCFGAFPSKNGIEADFRSFGRLDVDTMYELYRARMTARGTAAGSKAGSPQNGSEAAVLYDRTNELYILVTDRGGGQYLWVFDVTEQVQGESDGEIEIELDLDVVIPEPEHGGGGFLPSVGDWGEVRVPVDI